VTGTSVCVSSQKVLTGFGRTDSNYALLATKTSKHNSVFHIERHCYFLPQMEQHSMLVYKEYWRVQSWETPNSRRNWPRNFVVQGQDFLVVLWWDSVNIYVGIFYHRKLRGSSVEYGVSTWMSKVMRASSKRVKLALLICRDVSQPRIHASTVV